MKATTYDPRSSEKKWYDYWMRMGFFHSEPDKKRKPYTLIIPPPNVTGVLHMGHMLNNTIQDVLVRRARLEGKNACWVPGTDHASIATEAKVVAKLKAEGLSKNDIGREAFLRHAWEWTEKHGGIILEQLKRIGASCDWERTCFTMDKTRSESVVKVFIDLYRKGYIYKGVRMVNWDPAAQTAISDEEVIYKEEKSKLYYLRYKIKESDEYIVIATTRPETILGDTAVCVHPEDERYGHLTGKHCIVPIVNREIPIIKDAYVDREFGTGALKITPAHDINDYEIGYRHGLESVNIFNPDGTMNEEAGFFTGMDRFDVRKAIIPELEKRGNIVKIEDYNNKVGYSERTDAVIEPKLSMQWFLKMQELTKPALDAVMSDEILLTPAKYKNTYRHWMENVKDWCISRQLWWGHRIPAYYLPDSNKFVVAASPEEAADLAAEEYGIRLNPEELRQDEDCLDTWFSSWLWPISVFDGINNPENEEIRYYYPTDDLVSAPDILFFWIARMIVAGYEYKGEKPFSNVYLTGIVRDKLRRKMSKSLGNSPDPIELIDKYGADGVRVGMLLCSPAGGDLLFDESLPEQGRNFTTKIWNAYRLVASWETADIPQPEHSASAVKWFTHKLGELTETLNSNFRQYRISEALMNVYTGFKDEFSSWFLEIVKPEYKTPVDRKTYEAVIDIFEYMLQLLHPFMPFISEEIWQSLRERKTGESIMITEIAYKNTYDKTLIEEMENVKDIIVGIRNIRKENNIPFKAPVVLQLCENPRHPASWEAVIRKMGNTASIENIKSRPVSCPGFISNTVEYFLPMENRTDTSELRAKLENELAYTRGFLNSVMKKLGNEKFVSGAPVRVVENERKKKTDAEAKINALILQLSKL